MKLSTVTVVLAAGGTGGHLFPAQALAEELARRGIMADLFTDARGGRYQGQFPARAVHVVDSATLKGRNPLAMTKSALSLTRGLREAFALLGRLKPDAVIGFGGYPTVPPLLAARMRAIPCGLHEQNAVLGRANRMLGKRVTVIATSFEETAHVEGALKEKAWLTGNPVRDVVRALSGRPYQPYRIGDRFRLVVFGGSQGARFFTECVPPAIAGLAPQVRSRLQVTQQARPEDRDAVSGAYGALGVHADVADFFPDLPERIAASHLVIARAGASTIAELTVLGRPAILVPLPHALDNDQLHNATRLVNAGGAWLEQQAGLTPAALAARIDELVSRPDRLAQAALACKGQGRPDAVVRLADVVIGLIGRA